jgi:hypothetical protein
MRIARRFNAGCNHGLNRVPKGRLNPFKQLNLSRPSGTRSTLYSHPALKRSAIFGRPAGTTNASTACQLKLWQHRYCYYT